MVWELSDGWFQAEEISLIKTAELMKKYDVVIWAHHGMFCSGEDFDLTFGLLHTVEKSAEILVKILSMAPQKLQTITPNDFRALAKDFKVTLPEEFLYEKEIKSFSYAALYPIIGISYLKLYQKQPNIC